MSACVITNMLHFRHSKSAQLAYIVTDTDSDCGKYFNIFVTLPNVHMKYSIAVILIIGLYSYWYDVCFKVSMVVSGKDLFCQLVSNCVSYIHK